MLIYSWFLPSIQPGIHWPDLPDIILQWRSNFECLACVLKTCSLTLVFFLSLIVLLCISHSVPILTLKMYSRILAWVLHWFSHQFACSLVHQFACCMWLVGRTQTKDDTFEIADGDVLDIEELQRNKRIWGQICSKQIYCSSYNGKVHNAETNFVLVTCDFGFDRHWSLDNMYWPNKRMKKQWKGGGGGNHSVGGFMQSTYL